MESRRENLPVTPVDSARARYAFADFRARRSVNTLAAHDADLRLLERFLRLSGVDVSDGALSQSPETWARVSPAAVQAFVVWLLQQGYAVSSVNRALSTVRQYARLAAQAQVLPSQDLALITSLRGYGRTEGKRVDDRRISSGLPTRVSTKKPEPVVISREIAQALKRDHPDTPQGRRDAVLMCLLLDHGLRCGEVAGLTADAVNLTDSTLTFYRPKVDKVQVHQLTLDTRAALQAYLADLDALQPKPSSLLCASKCNGKLTCAKLTRQGIRARVQLLGRRHGIPNLSAHDCRHYWATTAARAGTDPFALQEAGGWNSLAMPRRYVSASRIANAGVKLE